MAEVAETGESHRQKPERAEVRDFLIIAGLYALPFAGLAALVINDVGEFIRQTQMGMFDGVILVAIGVVVLLLLAASNPWRPQRWLTPTLVALVVMDVAFQLVLLALPSAPVHESLRHPQQAFTALLLSALALRRRANAKLPANATPPPRSTP